VIPDSLEYSKYSAVPKVFMGLIENLCMEVRIKDDFSWSTRASTFEQLARANKELKGASDEHLRAVLEGNDGS